MQPIINEFVFNHTGSDTNEFVEIMGDANTDLSNFWILQIEGDSNSTTGRIVSAVQVGTTDANGYFATNFSNSVYQNGTSSLLLVEDFTGAVDDDIDIDNDGSIDNAPWTIVVDSVAVNDGGASDITYSSTVLSGGFDGVSFTPGGASRIPDGTDTDSASDWVRNDFDLAGIQGDGSTLDDGEALNTPGAENATDSNGGGNNGGGNNGGGNTVPFVPIYDIQGASHTSSFEGMQVRTSGVVTAVDSNGFYIQDVVGDGDIATSDGIFVFTGSAPEVSVGDGINITGDVSEYRPGNRSNDLTVTQISATEVIVTASDLPVPEAVILGTGGRMAPTENVEDDAFGSFDPETDGIDFYESLEGMRVTIEDAQVTGATNRFGETWAVSNQGANATGMNDRGGIQLTEGDNNPEKAQIQFDSGILDYAPGLNVGDQLGDVTGVVGYSYGNFEVKPTEEFDVTPGGLERETTDLSGNDDQLTIASYNVFNLDPDDTDGSSDVANGQFDILAQQIVNNLASPDVLALQEIQDNSGSNDDGTLSADQTLQMLVDAIAAAGGPQYEFVTVDPEFDGQQGGQPGGNIRNAYLYNADRVDLVEDSVQALTEEVLDAAGVTDPTAFAGSRIPLYAEWEFNGNLVSTINNHFSSKFGSTPVYGDTQPFIDAGVEERKAQSLAINEFVKSLGDEVAEPNVVVLGDLNDFEFAAPQALLESGGDDSQELFDMVK
ncbi:MAG: hypothetical protein MI743_09140, partial [Sneathiellales bacterium]|nr:hypothetical protein [Sneathiellales bacterium]